MKVKDRVPCKQLRDRLGINGIISVLQQNRLRWYGCVAKRWQWVGEEMYGVWSRGFHTKR